MEVCSVCTAGALAPVWLSSALPCLAITLPLFHLPHPQTWNVRRNIRRSVEYVQRKWPLWQRQLDQFATTW